MNRRFGSVLASIVLVVVVLAMGLTMAFAQEPVTIRFVSFQSGAVAEKWLEQIAEFEAETGIRVEYEYVPWTETVEKYLTMAAGDLLPDVAMIPGSWFPALAGRGLFHDLHQEEFPNLDFADFWPALLDAYNYEGKQFGLPTDLDLQLVFYNKDLFDEAGVAYPEPGWTWDDYRDIAAQLTQGEGVGKIYGSALMDINNVRIIAWCYGGDHLDPATATATFDSEGSRRAMAFVNALLVEDESAPLPGTEGVGIETGRVGMAIIGPWAAWYIFRDAEFEWDVVPLPRGTEQVVNAWGSTVGLLESSQNKEAAIKFMEFFLSPELQYQRVSDWAWFPPGRSATEMEGFMDESVLNMTEEQKQYAIDSIAYGRGAVFHQEQLRLYDIYNEELSLVTSGVKTMDEAITDIQAAWQEITGE